jgi:LytS/YehU family sensor histidine kinase
LITKRYTDERQRSAELESKLKQAELNALRMQLQPHFLFNTLNAISNFALEDPKIAVRMIARLGDFLRLTIETQERQFVSLDDELEFARKYLEIEQLRFSDRLDVRIDANSQALKAAVPSLILQPFIENAIKHGIALRSEAGRIEVSAERQNGMLRLLVANDGPTKSGSNNVRETTGIGIANARNRLSQLYGSDFVLDLERNGDGAQVLIEIPYSTDLGQKHG